MALTIGARLGVYEVTAAIGEGGMGEVYRAHDTTLHRDVAIKVLPDAFANDPERLARFQREAEVLASLNHPNIAQIHGLEQSDGVRALVLELVEGPTLADRIAQGAIPLDEALPIAKQIAEGLEAAHETGVIHRDLKPANIKVTPDGVVKILDFGLAKALEPDRTEADIATSPTMTAAATRAGIIMGTAAYMSPEQAGGKPVDKRSDIWAFGVVLFEVLTGQAPFTGETVSHVLAKVLEREPQWESLPDTTSPTLVKLLRRCLKKDPKQRVRDIGDVRLAMQGAFETAGARATSVTGPTQVALWQRPAFTLGSLILALVMGGLAVWSLTRSADVTPARLGRFTLTSPASDPVNISNNHQDLALSPDGTKVVYRAQRVDHAPLTVRAVDQLTGTPLDATGAPDAYNPFVSPDGAWVGFNNVRSRTLQKVSILGGPAVTICDIDSPRLHGASWVGDDAIIFGTDTPSGLWRVPAGGGTPEEITRVGPEAGEVNHGWPAVLPSGRAALFTILTDDLDTAQVALADLETGEHRVLLSGGHAPRYASTGHLVYAAAGALRAVGFDVDSLRVRGNPVPVVEDVGTKRTGAANFDLAEDGSLVYIPRATTGGTGARRTLVWVDRRGNEEPLAAEPRAYLHPRIAPDGTRVALDLRDEEDDIWIWDLARETLTRLTFAPEPDRNPAWTTDGQRVAFDSRPEGVGSAVFWRSADGTGTAERLTDGLNYQNPNDFTPDGNQLVIREFHPDTGTDLGVVTLHGERSSEPLLATEFSEHNGDVSPDGRWLAYQSNASGQFEVYVRPFPNVDAGRWQVSPGGGVEPLWGPDGRELFYRVQSGGVFAVTVETNPSFSVGNPEVEIEGDYFRAIGRNYDISPDGKRFLLIREGEQDADSASSAQLVLVQNWFQELKRLVPTN